MYFSPFPLNREILNSYQDGGRKMSNLRYADDMQARITATKALL